MSLILCPASPSYFSYESGTIDVQIVFLRVSNFESRPFTLYIVLGGAFRRSGVFLLHRSGVFLLYRSPLVASLRSLFVVSLRSLFVAQSYYHYDSLR